MKGKMHLWFIIILGLTLRHGYGQTDTSHVVNVNGIPIYYESMGSNQHEAILLIQGTGAQLTEWPIKLCRRLVAAGYRVIRFDNRDVGKSGKLDSLGMPDWAKIIPAIGKCDESNLPYTIKDMAKDAVGLLEALQIKKAHIVGASMGGAIAQMIAIHYPDRVRSLTCIMASTGNPDLPQGDASVRQIMATPPPATEDIEILAEYLVRMRKAMGSLHFPTPDSTLRQRAREAIHRSWYPIGSARQAAAIIIADNCDRRQLLRKISVPTVIIHGEQDPVVSHEAGKELASAIPNASFISIPGMGHDIPDQLAPTISSGILKAAVWARENAQTK